MSTSLDHLLPAADAAPRCAEHARSIDVDPGGTAIRADRVVVIDVALPWPKPALAHPDLVPVVETLAGSDVPTRVLAAVPSLGANHNTFTVFDRVGAAATERRFRIDGPASAASVAAAIIGRVPDDSVAHLALGPRVPAGPVALICTQGSHDVCCGSEGARLAAAVEAAAPTVHGRALEVRRVSHTGGHRFAPTALTLPDGRMWAGIDLELLVAALEQRADPALAAAHCRGWWGADQGAAQMAERAVLATEGWSAVGGDRTIAVTDQGGGRWHAVVSAGTESWDVAVAAGRAVPTIACRATGGLPIKSATEYEAATPRRRRPDVSRT